jgi:hypothetical protein
VITDTCPFVGVVAVLDDPTPDGRLLSGVGFRNGGFPLPVRSRDTGVVVGHISSLTAGGPFLVAVGVATDLDLAAVLRQGGAVTGGVDIRRLREKVRLDGLLEFTSWSVAAFTVHDSPTWSQVHLHRAPWFASDGGRS